VKRGPASLRGRARQAVVVLLTVSGALAVTVALTAPRSPEPPLSPAPGPANQAVVPTAKAEVKSSTALPKVMAVSVPTLITIPAIGVRSPVLTLGQRRSGAMEVPQPGPHYDDAGWYRYSPTPGARGPAIVVGHVDSAASGPSVFARLGSLRPRDLVRVSRSDGSVAVFAVDSVRRYAKATFPTQLVYANTDQAALRLITCGGPFERASGHYRDNIVVLASLVEQA
jgi:sortase (surface protein transpeptidase)